MPSTFIFIDESGCFAFNRKPNVSRYYILCSVTMSSCEVTDDLTELRYKLSREGAYPNHYFHATADKQHVRDRVYEVIRKHDFSVQATIMEKSKAHESIRASRPHFYKTGFFHHFKNGVTPLVPNSSEAFLTTACLGSRKERAAFQDAVSDVVRQTRKQGSWTTDFVPSQANPCLQVADYCAWAIQRKWERDDTRSYDLIKDRITYEYDLWRNETVHHY